MVVLCILEMYLFLRFVVVVTSSCRITMDPKNCGGGKRLPRIAASLIMRCTSEREPSFNAQRASLRPPPPPPPPPTPPTAPGLEFPDFPYSSAESKSMFTDSLVSAPSEKSSPSGLQLAGGCMLTSPTFTDCDNDSEEECLSLKSLNSPSERDDFLPGQSDTAESSPKRGKRTGGELDLSFDAHFANFLYS